jgi:translation initiation factor IF-2
MSELKLPRLLAAAKEFNIGQDTLIEFLSKKGFPKDDLKPAAKLTEDQYYALQAEFQGDKVARDKADHVELPKNAITDKAKKPEEAVAKKAAVAEALEAPKAEEAVAEKEAKPKAAKPAKEVTEVAPEQAATSNIKAPEVDAPKVINKIDLSQIDSSTRPKKSSAKKADEPKAPEEKAVAPKKAPAKKEAAAPKKEAPVDHSISPENVHGKIENIRADKLEGPKIMGKIDLPVNSDTRPKPMSQEEKRVRKRIPTPTGRPQQGGGQQGPGQQGGNRPGGGYQGQQGGNRPGGGYQGQGGNRPGGGARPGGNRNAPQTAEQKEIGQKAIQDKIKETQAKLSGQGGRGKSLKSKYRRAKREEAAENEQSEVSDNKLQVTEFVTVSELSSLMDVSFADIISKCMNLGIMVSINQRLDAEVIELVASEFGFEVEFVGLEDVEELDEEEEAEDLANLVERPPIVTIMGHVDHGKTSLLDYIRNANVVAGEAGGITQHIGAYEVTLPNGKAITFLDTPGHEAFTAMRARGAKVTDIAIIVVAADDAVMPQTKEAISHSQAASVPMIFAVNKIDKDGANPQKIYEQLSQMNILVEAWGGKFQNQELSAKQGLNVDTLLEKIILESDLLDLKANPNKEATGTIIEASLDKGRGYVATILVQNGTLKQGDLILSGQYYGRVKAMFNERNQRIEVAPPSTPVVILGLNGAPQAGEKFKVFDDESEAKELATKRSQLLREQGLRTRKHITLDEIGRRLALGNFKELNIIIKGDVDGSVEALSDSLQKLSTSEIAIRVVLKGVGQISESDVLLSAASDAIIIGFNVRPSMQANKLAEAEGVEIKLYSIIYNAIDELKSAMEGMLEPKIQEKIVANVEVREVYKFDKATVAGCFVLDGKLSRNSKIRIIRDGIVEYPKGEGQAAELGSLKRFKDDVKDVVSNMECGLTIKNFIDLKVGDIVEAFEEEEVKRTL